MWPAARILLIIYDSESGRVKMDAAIKILTFILLAIIAVSIGVEAGNLLYGLDKGLIENVDTENFKGTINYSLPIIETVYNSGKVSVSLSGEVKDLFLKIFDFDLATPVTILNVQSPLFKSYYNNSYAVRLSQDETGNAPADDKDKSGMPGTGDVGKVAKDDKDEKDDSGTEQQAPQNEPNLLLEPVSSIAYEEDDEEDEGNSEIVEVDKIAIKNFTKHKIDVAKLLSEPLDLDFSKKGPKVLVYHTHTSESYVLKKEDLGKKDVPAFNSNPKYNVVRVGEELAENLRKYGIETLHNATVHDNNRSAAYGVAIKTLESYMKSYPSIKVYIDIHRDAAKDTKYRPVTTINGKNAAQIMFVVGTNDQLPHDNWQENLKFALKIQKKLNEKYPGLARPMWIVGKRYNQHVSKQALLVEVGGDGNLLSECIESMKYLAEAINEVLSEELK